jgi:hypothetical protein
MHAASKFSFHFNVQCWMFDVQCSMFTPFFSPQKFLPCHSLDPWQITFDPASGGVPASTGCSMRWLHVEVDRLASLKAAQTK